MSCQLQEHCRPIRFHVRFGTFLMVAAAGALLCCNALGQSNTCSNPPSCVNLPLPGSPSWGYYSWQVSYGGVTDTLTSEMGICIGTGGPPCPSSPGVFSYPVTIPARTIKGVTETLIHEVHGNISVAVWSQPGCTQGAVIAQVRDNYGNTLAGVDLVGLAPGSYNTPIKATFGKTLTVTSLELETSTTQCGGITVSWSLVME